MNILSIAIVAASLGLAGAASAQSVDRGGDGPVLTGRSAYSPAANDRQYRDIASQSSYRGSATGGPSGSPTANGG